MLFWRRKPSASVHPTDTIPSPVLPANPSAPVPLAPEKAVGVVPVQPLLKSAAAGSNSTRPLLLVFASKEQHADFAERLTPMSHRWNLEFVAPESGLAAVTSRRPAVVVLDGSDPAREGIGQAEQVRARLPSSVQLLRSAEPLKSSPGVLAAVVERISLDPDPVEWDAAARRAVMIHTWLQSEAVKKLVAGMHKLPAIPAVYARVTEELRSPRTTFEFVAEIIATDPLMSAKILQVANSAYFGLAQRITNPAEAVLHLGFERIKGLILLANVFSQLETAQAAALGINQLWDHSLETANLAQTLMRAESKDEGLADNAFTAGLLHDVGKLLFAGNLPDEYRRVVREAREARLPLHEVERSVFGASHAELGGVLLGTWGLPADLIAAVGWHHSPHHAGDTAFSVLTAVHVASTFAHLLQVTSGKPAFKYLNVGYLRGLGLESHEDRWRRLCNLRTKADDEAADKAMQWHG